MIFQILHLKKGDYKSLLPEYYALADFVENNPWHLNQNVFDHVIAVFAGLEELLKFDFLTLKQKKAIAAYLEKRIGKYTRKELLIVATLLHDIAKSYLHIELDDENALCPGHEMIGASSVQQFKDRFGLDSQEMDHVQQIVHFHGFVNDVLTLIIHGKGCRKYQD